MTIYDGLPDKKVKTFKNFWVHVLALGLGVIAVTVFAILAIAESSK